MSEFPHKTVTTDQLRATRAWINSRWQFLYHDEAEHKVVAYYIGEPDKLHDCRDVLITRPSGLPMPKGPAFVYVIDLYPDANLAHDHIIGIQEVDSGELLSFFWEWPLCDLYEQAKVYP